MIRTDEPRNVPALLNRMRQEERSATVLVSGSPGGSIHLRDGLVVAVHTPGAPGVESQLLKSQRVDEQTWAAAAAAARAARDDGITDTDPYHAALDAALVGQGVVGRAELDLLHTAAVFDGAFALALTTPTGWELSEPVPVSCAAGVEPARLAEETARRFGHLSQHRGPVGEFARTRIQAATPLPVRPGARHAAVLSVVNGRRTPRDIAFALGRGLYAVMADLIRMDALGLLRREQQPPPADRPSTAPRVAGPPPQAPPAPAGPLPRRAPGSHPLGGASTDQSGA
ncbi:hypothetical protein [Streptomyces sp. NPDC008150]|uniref:hypothetical protein n=1 Tax=Streptomyces sp. NPDC008150 TaxID=3364816 RepID=UPI0036E501A9